MQNWTHLPTPCRFRSSLSTHLRGSHRGDRPHPCGVCGRRFVKAADLRVHARTHSDERPYPCGVCGKRFARPDYRRKHLRLHAREVQQQQQQPHQHQHQHQHQQQQQQHLVSATEEAATAVEEMNALLGEGILSEAVALDTLEETRDAIELVLDPSRDIQ